MNTIVLMSSVILQMRQSFVRPMFRFCLLVNPVLNTILLYEMYRNAGENSFMAYVVLGAGVMGLWSCICFSSVGDIGRERYSGTLALIFAAPASFHLIVLGKIIGNTLLSLLTFTIALVTATALFRVPISLESPFYFFVALLGAILAFVVVSFMIACIILLSRKSELYMNCLEIPIVLLCGFVFPIEILPKSVQIISYTLSPTYAIELLRMAVLGVGNITVFLQKCFWLLGITTIYIIISILLYREVDRRVRVIATLEVA